MITIKANGKMKIRISYYNEALERKSSFEVDETTLKFYKVKEKV